MKEKVAFLLVCIVLRTFSAECREVVSLNGDWKFCNAEVAGGENIDLDDEGWETVLVPHDWAIEGPFNLNLDLQFTQVIENGDKEAKLLTGRTGALPVVGVGWYRKEIHLHDLGNDRFYVEFDGVMSYARVYVNGAYVGERPYGYSSFSFDITSFLKQGENVLAVRAGNKPEMSRFYTGAGIYRPVRLVRVSPVHVAHWGTYVTTPVVSGEKGTVKVRTLVNNFAGKQEIRLRTSVYDSEGKRVGVVSSSSSGDGKECLFEQECKVRKPLLWSPDAPNLYTAVSEVYSDGGLCDTYTTVFGFRSLKYDKDEGFFLNGKHLKIKGVCLHHDLGPLGAAVNRRAIERQVQMMKEMGCNAIRTSHNPPAVELLDICDRLGMMVQVEAFDEWEAGKCRNGYNVLFKDWAETDLVSLIHRDRNHPSIIMWSIGNELREQDQKRGAEIARYLSDIVHREDPTRPSTAGFNNHWAAIDNGLADAVDLVGFNYKHFDYANQHQQHPEYILYGSETCSAVSSRGVYKFPLKDNWNPWYDDYQVSSYDMDYVPWGSVPDTELAQQEDHEFLLGEFVWTGFDYLGEPSPYGEGAPSRSSYFGIVDLAGLKKDRYYLYQSLWSDKPVLHLMPHWTWPEYEGKSIPVQCYTNYPKVELFVNGKSKGVRTRDVSGKFTRYRMIWESVPYEPGELKVVAYDGNDSICAEQAIHTASASSQIRLTADRRQINADGSDLSFITVEVVDGNGNLCPHSSALLFVQVRGKGHLKALCNGDPTDQTSFASNYMRVFNGKMVAVVQAADEEGEISISVSGERLQAANIVVDSHKNPEL